MAETGSSIGAVFIEVAVKGLQAAFGAIRSGIAAMKNSKVAVAADTEAAKAKVAALRQEMEKLRATNVSAAASGFQSISDVASRSFATLTASVLGFTRMASPVDFDNLTLAIARVSIQIGRIFLPIIREVGGWLNRLAAWLRSLSDVQRASVMGWTRIALAVTGVLTILPRLVSVVSLVAGVFSGLVGVFGVLTALNPFAWVALAVAGLAALAAAMNTQGSIAERLGQIWKGLQNALSSLWRALQPLVNVLAGVLVGVLASVSRAFLALSATLEPVATALLAAVVPAIAAVAGAFERILASLQPVGEVIGSVFAALVAGVELVLGAVEPLIGVLLAVLVPALNGVCAALEFFGSLLGYVAGLLATFMGALQAIYSAVAPVVAVLASALNPALGALGSIFAFLQPLISAVVGYFVIFKGILLVTSGVMVAIRVAMLALTTGFAGLSAGVSGVTGAFSVLLSHPIVAGLAGITTAALYLSGAFNTVAQKIDTINEKAAKLKQGLEALEQGRKLQKEDLDKLPVPVRNMIVAAGDDREKQKEVFKKMEAFGERRLASMRSETEEAQIATIIQDALSRAIPQDKYNAARGFDSYTTVREGERIDTVFQALKAKGYEEDKARGIALDFQRRYDFSMANLPLSEKQKLLGQNTKEGLSGEAVEKLVKVYMSGFQEQQFQYEFAKKALAQGGIALSYDARKKEREEEEKRLKEQQQGLASPPTKPGEKPQQPGERPDQKYIGQVRQPQQLISLVEAWRKAQLAAGANDIQARIQQDQLNQAKLQTSALDAIVANTSKTETQVATWS